MYLLHWITRHVLPYCLYIEHIVNTCHSVLMFGPRHSQSSVGWRCRKHDNNRSAANMTSPLRRTRVSFFFFGSAQFVIVAARCHSVTESSRSHTVQWLRVNVGTQRQKHCNSRTNDVIIINHQLSKKGPFLFIIASTQKWFWEVI